MNLKWSFTDFYISCQEEFCTVCDNSFLSLLQLCRKLKQLLMKTLLMFHVLNRKLWKFKRCPSFYSRDGNCCCLGYWKSKTFTFKAETSELCTFLCRFCVCPPGPVEPKSVINKLCCRVGALCMILFLTVIHLPTYLH